MSHLEAAERTGDRPARDGGQPKQPSGAPPRGRTAPGRRDAQTKSAPRFSPNADGRPESSRSGTGGPGKEASARGTARGRRSGGARLRGEEALALHALADELARP